MNKIKTLFIITLTIGSIFCNVFISFNSINAELLDIIDYSDSSNKETENIETNSDGWYYLPAYSNYAPNGLPDFSEIQQDDWFAFGRWKLCGATSIADVLWWFDSEQSGYPGDGNDDYPLVKYYHSTVPPNPGPYFDDHNFNNVNDNRTPRFRYYTPSGELIEQVAWYTCRIEFSIFWEKIDKFGIFEAINLFFGIKKWIKDAGLQDRYSVKVISRPSFSLICENVTNNSGVILSLINYDPASKPIPLTWGHYVAVAGINPNEQIALSDPIRDKTNPSIDSAEHNNASIVSHDIWNVSLTSPYKLLSSWWLPGYAKYGVIVNGAIIISEKK
jgi:hypothetical protein